GRSRAGFACEEGSTASRCSTRLGTAADRAAGPEPAAARTTTTLFACGPAPAIDCVSPRKCVLIVGEKKLRVAFSELQMAVAPAQFGDPVTGTTSYEVCIYDAADRLKGAYTVARAGDLCGRLSCWSTISEGIQVHGQEPRRGRDPGDPAERRRLRQGEGPDTRQELVQGDRGVAPERDRRDGSAADERCVLLQRGSHPREEGERRDV